MARTDRVAPTPTNLSLPEWGLSVILRGARRGRSEPRRPPSLLVITLFASSCLVPALSAASGDSSGQAREHADEGMRLVQSGDLKGAEAELRWAVELDPDNSVYLGSLGAVLGMEQDLPESNVYLEKALRLNPQDSASRRNLASNQFQLGLLQPAKANLEKLLKAKPTDSTGILLLGMVDEELRDYANAARLLASVPHEIREQPKSMAALARAYYHTDEKAKARETLKELLSHPGSPEGIFLGGQVADLANDYEMAERMFTAIKETYPDPAKLGYAFALAQYHAKRIRESQDTLTNVLQAGHNTADIYNLLGWCLFKQGMTKEAVAALDKAIALDPAREANYLDIGMVLTEAGRYEGAMVAAQKALEVAPDSYRAYRLKGLVENKLNRLKDSERSYAQATELNPADEQSILGLASGQLNEGKIQEAEATFDKGIQRLPDDALLYQAYGSMLLWLQGAIEPATEARAVSLLRTAIRLDGTQAVAHYQLGRLALRQGRTEEALQELETAARLDPKSPRVHYMLATAYRKLGRKKDAERELAAYQNLKAEEGKPASLRAPGENEYPIPEQKPIPAGIEQSRRD